MAFIAIAPALQAQPWDGGEITWECTPQGNFRFVMKIYRECEAITLPTTLSLESNAPGFSSISMTKVSMNDLSPQCNCPGGVPVSCATTSNYNIGTIQLNVYTSDNAYPNGVPLTGVPPATGWHFAYVTCCRSWCSNIANSASANFFLRAIMYPYNNMPVDSCFDNSPRFMEPPQTIVCTKYPYFYNFSATDAEPDSLVYAWSPPLQNITSPIVTYNPGYSFDAPLPGPTHSPGSIQAVLNPKTGLVSGTSFLPGNFISAVKVTAYRCGIKLAEIFRDVDLAIQHCDTANILPGIPPPFPNSVGQYTLYSDTVYAGQIASFPVVATDFQYCPNNIPPVPQEMTLTAFGSQFGTPMNPSGCLNPPCAMLSPAPTDTAPLTGQFGVQTTFTWQTGCQHVFSGAGCGATTNQYDFLFKAKDNFCPVPGIRYATITLVVLDLPEIAAPDLLQPVMLPAGDVELIWHQAKDTTNSFNGYFVWSANTPAGPFTLIDSVMNIADTSYTHIGAGADMHPVCYYITMKSGCFGTHETRSDTVCGTTVSVPEKTDRQFTFTLGNSIPNPSPGFVTIPFTLPDAGKVKLVISDITGKTLINESHLAETGTNRIEQNLSNLSPGTYFCTLSFKGMHQTKLLMIR